MTQPPVNGGHPLGDGRYTLTERIATGGMGEVWRAVDTVLGRNVAVKILRPEYADDATFRARFQAEARNTAALHHPGIAQVFDFGETAADGSGHTTAFLVMELVPGEPLSAVLSRQGSLSPDEAADVVAQAAAAIDVAHGHGIVHRDVKPANILVTPDGTVKVTDFGIARAGDAVPLTHTGQVVGTPHYLSPEQAQGRPATPASDVYALAVVLYECLNGRRPFVADSNVAVAMQQIQDPVPPLPDSVPAGLAAITMQALAKEPGDRPASAGELAARLRNPPGPTEHTAVLAAPAYDQPADHAPTTHRRRRPGWVVPVLAAVALLVLLAMTAIGLGNDDAPRAGSGGGDGGQGSTERADRSSSSKPDRVLVDPAEYVGRPFAEVRGELTDAGFGVRGTKRVGVDGTPGTVAYVQPHNRVATGSMLTVGVWRPPAPAPSPEDQPSPEGGDDHPGEAKGHDKSGGKGHSGGDEQGED